MKKKHKLLLMLHVALLFLMIISCDKSESKSPKRHEDFEVIKKINIPETTDAYIMRDKATGVKYLYFHNFPHESGICRYWEQ